MAHYMKDDFLMWRCLKSPLTQPLLLYRINCPRRQSDLVVTSCLFVLRKSWWLFMTELHARGLSGNEAKPQREHCGRVSENTFSPFSPPPQNWAHPHSAHPLPALDQWTWEAGPPGLEGRMNTMINMFSRPLVFLWPWHSTIFSWQVLNLLAWLWW